MNQGLTPDTFTGFESANGFIVGLESFFIMIHLPTLLHTHTHAHMHAQTHTSVKTDIPQDPSTSHLEAAFSLFPAPDKNGQEAQHWHSHGDRCFMLRTTMAATHSALSSHSPQQVSSIVATPTPYLHSCCPWELPRRKE